MPCFPGTTLVCLVSTCCRRLDNYSTLFCLSPIYIHTSCIPIGLQHPYEKWFPPIHTPKALLKNSSYGPETTIDGPGASIEYSRWPDIIYALGLMNLSTMDLLAIPQYLSTVVENNVSKLSMINTSGRVSFPIFLYSYLGENKLVPTSFLALSLLFCLGTLCISLILGVLI